MRSYWWTIGSNRLSGKALSLMEDKANTILVRAVSFYDLDNNMRLKKLDLKPQGIADRGDCQRSACELATAFAWDRGDGWNRIQVTQPRLEHGTFLSTEVVRREFA